MYNSINPLGWLTLIIGAVIVYKWVKRKALGVVVLILAVIAVGAVSLKVRTSLWFETPAEAALFPADGTMIAAIEGQDSCCLITEQSRTEHQIHLLGKENNRYRLLAASEWNSENIQADDGMAVTILSVNGTSDCYAYGTFFEPAGSKIQITDTNGTVFQTISLLPAGSETAVLAYACVGPVNAGYGVQVAYTS